MSDLAAKPADGQRPRSYDAKEAAEVLRMSRMTVYRACREGQIRAVRVRNRWLIPARVIDELAAAGE